MVTLGGVQLADVYLPWGDSGTFVLGQDLAIPVTILLTVLTINAVNFIDGLDGLAAGRHRDRRAGVLRASATTSARASYLQIAAAPTLICGRAGRHLPRLPAAQLLPGPDLHG